MPYASISSIDIISSMFGKEPKRYIREITTRPTEAYDPLHTAVTKPEDLAVLMKAVQDESIAKIFAILLDEQYLPLSTVLVGVGVKPANLNPRSIWFPVSHFNADRLILLRNQPAGDPHPTENDRILMKDVSEMADRFKTDFSDYVIVGGNSYWARSLTLGAIYEKGTVRPIPED